MKTNVVTLELVRSYYPSGTNGDIYAGGALVCHSIELPWKDNRHQVSCIPEGSYAIGRRFSPRFGWHLEVKGVAKRSGILIHPANDALHELKGCIAPVSQLSGAGKGERSRLAMEKLCALLFPVLENKTTVMITIQSENYEPHTKILSPHPLLLQEVAQRGAGADGCQRQPAGSTRSATSPGGAAGFLPGSSRQCSHGR
jgi:hypothetical protein